MLSQVRGALQGDCESEPQLAATSHAAVVWCSAFPNHLPRIKLLNCHVKMSIAFFNAQLQGQSSQLPAGRPFPLRCQTFLLHGSTGKATKMHLLNGVERVSKLLFPGSQVTNAPDLLHRSLMLLIRYTPTCEQVLLSNNTVRIG